jgi:hypothetical protein
MTAWPVGSDLETWIGNTVSTETSALASALVSEATALALQAIRAESMPAPTTAPLTDGVCPAPIFRAIILDAARLLSRRGSQSGIENFGDFAARVASVDADYQRLMRPYVYWPTL